jgi:hypothetical protein
MTEAAFLAWVRSALRSKSLRWPPRNEALELARRAYKGSNKLQKWEYHCAICKEWYKAKEVCVDHYPKPAGSILSVADIGEFVNNLYCEVDNLRVLCVPCHAVHTLAEKEGITFEEAQAAKKVNEIMKQPVKKVLAFLAENGYTNPSDVSNATKRKELVTTILKGERDA